MLPPQVRWLGYSSKDDSWEAEDAILSPILVEEFHAEQERERERNSVTGVSSSSLAHGSKAENCEQEQEGEKEEEEGEEEEEAAGTMAALRKLEDYIHGCGGARDLLDGWYAYRSQQATCVRWHFRAPQGRSFRTRTDVARFFSLDPVLIAASRVTIPPPKHPPERAERRQQEAVGGKPRVGAKRKPANDDVDLWVQCDRW